MLATSGMMIQDPTRRAKIVPVTLEDKADSVSGFPTQHLGNIHQGNGAGDIKKLLELYSGKSMTEFLTENPLTPAQAHPPTESYRFDILKFGNEEKCERRQFPGDGKRDNASDKSITNDKV